MPLSIQKVIRKARERHALRELSGLARDTWDNSYLGKSAEPDAVRSYLKAIAITGDTEALTSYRVLDFAKSVGPDEARSYFDAIAETRNTEALTSDRVLEFAKSAGPYTAYNYFNAIARTGNIEALISDMVISAKVAEFTKSAEPDTIRSYFTAIAKTGDTEALTSKRVLKFAKSVGQSTARSYFDAIAETGDTEALTSDRVLKFAKSVGSYTAYNYFTAIAKTGNTEALTSDKAIGILNRIRDNEELQSSLLGLLSRMQPKNVEHALDLSNRIGAGAVVRESAETLQDIFNNGLGKLVTDRERLDAVACYISAGKHLPMPTEENIGRYLDVLRKHTVDEYGISPDVSLNYGQIRMLVSLGREERTRAVALANMSVDAMSREYNITGTFEKHPDMNSDKAIEHIIRLIKNGDTESRSALSEIVGEKVVNLALEELKAKRHSGVINRALELSASDANAAFNYLKEKFSKNERVNDLLVAAEAVQQRSIVGAKLISASESRNPLDFDNRKLFACIFLPTGARRESVLEYCEDPRARLVRYEIDGETHGVAVALMNDGKLFVNSIEGSISFRDQRIYTIVLEDMIWRAREEGADTLIFNAKPTNATPRKFVEFLNGSGLSPEETEMNFGGFKGTMDLTSHYRGIEAVDGYVINVQRIQELNELRR